MATTIPDVIRPVVRELSAYAVATPQHRIKLNQNESTVELPTAVKDEILARLRARTWSRYPNQHATSLRETVRRSYGLDGRFGAAVGNGSNELLQAALSSAIDPGDGVLLVTPTFALYRQIATLGGASVIEISLTDELEMDTSAVVAAVRREQPRVILLGRPNNPTGRAFPLADLVEVADAASALLVIDEAYAEFAEDTALTLLEAYPNLAITRTFSKALRAAGLRIGCLLGHRKLISEISKVLLPFNLDVFSIEAAQVILSHRAELEAGISGIIAERERVTAALEGIPGVRPIPSHANFLCFRASRPVENVFRGLLERGILVRNVSGYPLLSDALRVTIGTPEENDEFLTGIEAIMESI